MTLPLALPLLLLALALAPQPAAGATLPTVPAGTPYAAARERLRAAGWHAYSHPNRDDCAERNPRCRRFPETYACSDSGDRGCYFTWRRGRVVIGVLTAGDPPVVRSVRRERGRH